MKKNSKIVLISPYFSQFCPILSKLCKLSFIIGRNSNFLSNFNLKNMTFLIQNSRGHPMLRGRPFNSQGGVGLFRKKINLFWFSVQKNKMIWIFSEKNNFLIWPNLAHTYKFIWFVAEQKKINNSEVKTPWILNGRPLKDLFL